MKREGPHTSAKALSSKSSLAHSPCTTSPFALNLLHSSALLVMVGHEGSHFLKLLPPLPRLHQVREIAQALTGGDGMVCLYPLKVVVNTVKI